MLPFSQDVSRHSLHCVFVPLCVPTDTNRTGILTLPSGGLAEWCSDCIWLKKSILGGFCVLSSIFWGWRSTLCTANIFLKITCKGVTLLSFPAAMKMPRWVPSLLLMDSREDVVLKVCLCVRCCRGGGCVLRNVFLDWKLIFRQFWELRQCFLYLYWAHHQRLSHSPTCECSHIVPKQPHEYKKQQYLPVIVGAKFNKETDGIW